MLKTLSFVVLFAFVCGGCVPSPSSGKGFTLPTGDPGRGAEEFVNLQCNACHFIDGIEQLAGAAEAELSVGLGGEVPRIKTYGELVTSIINPSHRLARGYPEEAIAEGEESKMRNYNDVMTVTQLIDLVAFLQSKYELQEYDPSDYPSYYYGL
jgi:sulfur-oxidizing protein SoxX